MNLTFAGHRCCDHSPSSGYDQVCSLFPAAGWLSGPQLVAGKLAWMRRPANDTSPGRPGQIFHVFYGDCSGSALPGILRARFPSSTILSTVHQPVSRLVRDPDGWASLRAVDQIITVSRTQAQELADCGITIPVQVIPHGVWTHIFRPPVQLRPNQAVSRDGVLMVGSYLRDWSGTREILRRLAAVGVRSVVLGRTAAARLEISNPLVRLVDRVPESKLAQMYNDTAALLLPVLAATASNALLEALAVGCPVVCPRLPSLVEDYIGDDYDTYPPEDYAAAVARALAYVRDPGLRAARSRVLIRRAELFDWTRLRPLLSDVYRSRDRPGSRSTGR